MATSYFDFHLHPIFKQFITQFSPTYPPVRDVTELGKSLKFGGPIVQLLDQEFLHMLESQSCLEQMNQATLSLGVAALCPMEQIFTSRDELFGKLLNSNATRPLSQELMRTIRDGKVSYYGLLIRELNLYKQLRNAGQIEILTRKTPIDVEVASNKTRLVLSLEGGHGLCRTMIGESGVRDTKTEVKPANAADALSNDLLNQFTPDPAQSLRQLQQALWDENMDLCYLVLTHLSHIDEQLLATHAYGMKMLKNQVSIPVSTGISVKGFDVIRAAYTLEVVVNGTKKPAPVIIDVKHMSLKSRLDLYAFRTGPFKNIPIICSHVGVTGYSISAWKEALETARRVRLDSGELVIELKTGRKTAGRWGAINSEFTYNAWTVNLMDEDIEVILESNGLIGVSLDVRILGWHDTLSTGETNEFMSSGEFRHFFPERFAQLTSEPMESFLVPTRQERHPLSFCFNLLHIISVGLLRTNIGLAQLWKQICIGSDYDGLINLTSELMESFLVPTRQERHPLSFCFNLLHIISVGLLRTNIGLPQLWKHICIGSDYDGLINPLINCRDISQLSELESNLLRWLPVAEKAYRDENGGQPLLERDDVGEVDMTELKAIVRNVMFNNGKQFIKNWLI